MGLCLHFYKRKEKVLSIINSEGYLALIKFLDLYPNKKYLLSKEYIENVIISQCDKICEKGENGIEELKKNNELVFDDFSSFKNTQYDKRERKIIIYYTLELKDSLKLITDRMKKDEIIEFCYNY